MDILTGSILIPPQPRQHAAPQAPPPMPSMLGATYQLSMTPGHLMGTFDITDESSAEEVIRAINAWKVLFRPVGQAKRPLNPQSDEPTRQED